MSLRGFEIVSAYRERQISLPQRKTARSAGYDLAAAEAVELLPGKVALVPTGLKAYMQANEYLGLHIRSGLALTHALSLINGQGIVDADYYDNPDNEGHIMIACYNTTDTPCALEKGERVGQGIFMAYLTVSDDAADGIRSGGIGSTGTK